MAGLYRPDAGRVLWAGRDLAGLDRTARRLFRRRVQIIFQDPVSSLNPRFTAGATVEEGLVIHGLGSSAERRAKVAELLREVGLPAESARHFSHEFSGGQRQRLSLARALALDPEVLIADEPVSALDVSIQAQVMNLLLDLRVRRGLTLVLISHDLPLVRVVADRLAVMYGGRLMEVAAAETLGRRPHHPYVEALWASAGGVAHLEGEPPDPGHPPAGCPFAPRCREAGEDCRAEAPPLTWRTDDFACACRRLS
jgi:oligopeptide/dipeptide ABC transporter ATP-binding protein